MKKRFCIIFLIGAVLLMLPNSTFAVLQANGNQPVQYMKNDWAKMVRKMEELGGAMGLEETLNDDLTATNTQNNIDVHMQKNTEYGAMAILSASSYGNPNKIETGGTTTGNATGVVMPLTEERVLTYGPEEDNQGIATRYFNRYAIDESGSVIAKTGDALYETRQWHESVFNLRPPYDLPLGGAIARGNGAMLAVTPGAYHDIHEWQNAVNGRAVVVCGEGF